MLALAACEGGKRVDRLADGIDCGAEPSGSFQVFVADPGARSPVRLRGRIASSHGPDVNGFSSILVLDLEGSSHRIAYTSPVDPLPPPGGTEYEIEIEWIGGFPSTSALSIRDAAGLVFAAASDQTVGGHVLRQGLPGFSFALVDAGCPSRRSDRCYRALVNRALEVGFQGATVRLGHGSTGRLGPYRVSCLTAQRVEYDPACKDAGLHALSWSVVRTQEQGAGR